MYISLAVAAAANGVDMLGMLLLLLLLLHRGDLESELNKARHAKNEALVKQLQLKVKLATDELVGGNSQ